MPPKPPVNEEPAQPLKPAPGKLVLIGSGLIFQDQLVNEVSDPVKLLGNALDYFTGAQDLLAIRQKTSVSRLIPKASIKDGQIWMWKYGNIGGFSLVCIAGGLVYFMVRRGGRREYQNAVNRRDA
jgi:hypothetical protein